MIREIVVYGAGGFGRELAWLAESCTTPDVVMRVASFVDDNPAVVGTEINGVPVMGLNEAHQRHPAAEVAVGVGDPRVREVLTQKAVQRGFKPATLVHPNVEMSRWITVGQGTVICAGSILTTNITLGEHVQINLDCTVGHDVVMGDYCTLAPGVHISGCVHLGRGVYLGTGAVVINGNDRRPLVIGDEAVVGAAACVVKSVDPRVTVVGVPAKQVFMRV